MNKIILCLTFLLLGMCTAYAETGYSIDPSLYYVKLGGGSMPGGEPSISLSVGGRHRWGNHGLDVSLNGQTFYAIFVFDGLLTTKAQ